MQSDKMAPGAENAITATTKKVAVKETSKKSSPAKKAVSKAAPQKAVKAAKPASAATKKAAASSSKQTKSTGKLRLRFEVFYSTRFGEELLISGAHPALGDESADRAPVMEYMDDQKWAIELEVDKSSVKNGQLNYTYLVRDADGTLQLSAPYRLTIGTAATSLTIRDAWNAPGFVENVFGTDALQAIGAGPASGQSAQKKVGSRKKYTHRFIITAPPLEAGKAVCLIGEDPALGNWEAAKAVVMNSEADGRWSIDLSLSGEAATTGIAYKYGIYDLATAQLDIFEAGENRILDNDPTGAGLLILQNGFIRTN